MRGLEPLASSYLQLLLSEQPLILRLDIYAAIISQLNIGVLKPIQKPIERTELIRKTSNRKKNETENEKTESKLNSLVWVWGELVQN